MWELSSETIVVAAAHRLRTGLGEEERAHGHLWRVRAVVRASRLDAQGFVADCNELNPRLRALLGPFEGRTLNDLPPFDDLNPTAENLARFVAVELAKVVDDGRASLHRVEVWKDDQCCATYFPEPPAA